MFNPRKNRGFYAAYGQLKDGGRCPLINAAPKPWGMKARIRKEEIENDEEEIVLLGV